MRTILRLVVLAVLTASLSACNILEALLLNSHSITVVNGCTGPNTTVDFYLDGTYKGAVYLTRTFSGVSEATHTLYAEGTGRGGARFERSVYVDSDIRWTLCP